MFSKKTVNKLSFILALIILFFSVTLLPKYAWASEPWSAFYFNPRANTNNDHSIFLSDFEKLVRELKSRQINTIIFDMNYYAFRFACTDRFRNKLWNHPAGGFTADETRRMAQIARASGMKVMVAMQVITHSVAQVFPDEYPEYMLPGKIWRESEDYLGGTGYAPDFVDFQGTTYKCKKRHISSPENAPPNSEFWVASPSDVRDPFNREGEEIVFAMIDELVDAFTVDGIRPEGFHIESDELGNWYEDPVAQTGMTSGQIYAMALNNSNQHVKSKYPGIEVIVWGDMLDPLWNGAPGNKNTADAVDLLSKEIIIADWRYSKNHSGYDSFKKIFSSVSKFTEKGFRVWPTSWSDPEATEDLIWTGNMEQARSGKIAGHIYSTWLGGVVPEMEKLLKDPDYQVPDSVLTGVSDADKPRFRQYYRGVADSINATHDLIGETQCRGTDYFCGSYPKCENYNLKDGFYDDEFRDYYCENNLASFQIIDFPSDYRSYWKFEGDARDENNFANGTFQNGAAISSDEARGQVASFDGIDDLVYMGSPSELRINQMGNKVTLSTWIKWKGHVGSSARIGGFQGYFGDYAMWVMEDGRILFEVDGQHGNAWYSAEKIEKDKWYHIAGSFDIDHARIYIDGKLVLEKTPIFYPPMEGTAPFRIGNKEAAYFFGFIDDFMVFDRALSTPEILRIYADQGGGDGYVREKVGPNDLNKDFSVDEIDFEILKNDFLKLTANLANPKSDVNGDGQATIKDVGIMMSGWEN